MRDFAMISPAIWESGKFKFLEDDSSRLLLIYILTSRHSNSAGCYRLPKKYASTDLCWDDKKTENAFNELIENQLIVYDDCHEVVLIYGWFKYNLPRGKSHLQGLGRQLTKVQSGTLVALCLDELKKAKDFVASQNDKSTEKLEEIYSEFFGPGSHFYNSDYMNGRLR